MRLLEDAEAIWWAGVNAVQPDRLMSQWLAEYSPNSLPPIALLAVGKAACAMAQAVASRAPVAHGLVVTKHGHGHPVLGCRVMEAGHPVPDEASVVAAEAVKAFCQAQQPGQVVWVLLSGGASALLADLPPDLTLADWQRATQVLLASGANIHDINTLRKAIGTLKGGKLLALLADCRVSTLAISDVIGDVPGSIGSGLTVPMANADKTALQHLVTRLSPALPASVTRLLHQTQTSGMRQTCLPESTFHILGSAQVAVQSAAICAHERGYQVQTARAPLQLDVPQEAEQIAQTLQQGVAQPTAYLWWGEPTVILPDMPGNGGRNQHLAVCVSAAMQHAVMANKVNLTRSNWFLLSAGTDGTDGPTDIAGGWVDNQTVLKTQQLLMDLQDYIDRADAGEALALLQQHFITGATQTNVMDLVIGLVDPLT